MPCYDVRVREAGQVRLGKPVKVHCTCTKHAAAAGISTPTCSDFMSFASSLWAHWASWQGGEQSSRMALGMARSYWPTAGSHL